MKIYKEGTATAGAVSYSAPGGATRTTAQVLGENAWLDDFVGATDTQKFQDAATKAVPWLKLPARTITTTAKVTLNSPMRISGAGAGKTDWYANVNDWALETSGPFGNFPRAQLEDFTLRGNRAHANSGGCMLFDNSLAPVQRLTMYEFSKPGLYFRRGVGISAREIRMYNIGGANNEYALVVTGDDAIPEIGQAADFIVAPLLENVYITQGGPGDYHSGNGFKINRARFLAMRDCTSEFCRQRGIYTNLVDGVMDGYYDEGSQTEPGKFIASGGLIRSRIGGTTGEFSIEWVSEAGWARAMQTNSVFFSTAYSNIPFTASSAGGWHNIPMHQTGEEYFASHGGSEADRHQIVVQKRGLAEVGGIANMIETAGAVAYGGIRIALTRDAVTTSINGTETNAKVLANGSRTLTANTMLMLEVGDILQLQFSPSATTLILDVDDNGGNGVSASAFAANAHLWVKSLGAIK